MYNNVQNKYLYFISFSLFPIFEFYFPNMFYKILKYSDFKR